MNSEARRAQEAVDAMVGLPADALTPETPAEKTRAEITTLQGEPGPLRDMLEASAGPSPHPWWRGPTRPVPGWVDISDIPGATPVAVRTLWLPVAPAMAGQWRVGIHYALSQTARRGWHAQMLFWVREPTVSAFRAFQFEPPGDWQERARFWGLAHRDQVWAALLEDIAGVAPVRRWRLPAGAE
jgi:hypothetical protein